MTPSNANTSGLAEISRLLRDFDEWPFDEANYDKYAALILEVTAASAQARIDAAEARADRLAQGITSAKLILTPEPGDKPMTEREKTARQFLAALQQETQP